MGLSSFIVGYKGNLDLGAVTLFSSLSYESPLGTSELTYQHGSNSSSSPSSGNAIPDQSNIKATVGPVFNTDAFIFGALFRYIYNLEGNYKYIGLSPSGPINQVTNYTRTKGDTFVFGPTFEFKNSFHPNFQVSYGRSFSNTSQEVNVAGSDYTIDGSSWLAYAGSVRYNLSPAFEINSKISYLIFDKKSTVTDGNMTNFTIGSRFLF